MGLAKAKKCYMPQERRRVRGVDWLPEELMYGWKKTNNEKSLNLYRDMAQQASNFAA